MKVSYEWAVEEIDKHNDIADSNFFDTLPEALDYASKCISDGIVKADVGLCRYSHDTDGSLKDRTYAYIRDGKLDVFLRDSYDNPQHNVPKKYIKEASRLLTAVAK